MLLGANVRSPPSEEENDEGESKRSRCGSTIFDAAITARLVAMIVSRPHRVSQQFRDATGRGQIKLETVP